MSHIVTVQTHVRNPAAIAAACQRLKLTVPVHGTAQLFSGHAEGLLLQLPGWDYPVVIDKANGTLRYDNYGGAWGETRCLERLLQMYAVEAAKLEARKRGHQVSEQALQDGSIKLCITTDGS